MFCYVHYSDNFFLNQTDYMHTWKAQTCIPENFLYIFFFYIQKKKKNPLVINLTDRFFPNELRELTKSTQIGYLES